MRVKEKSIKKAGCIIYNHRGEVLLFRQPSRKPFLWAFPWSFPKGGVDNGESLEEAARRETFEETGVVAEITGRAGVVRYERKYWPDLRLQPIELTLFYARAIRREPVHSIEGYAKWVPADEARGLLDKPLAGLI